MKISSKIKLTLRSLLLKAGSVETDKATLLYDADELEIGTEVYVENAEGEIVPAENGEYIAGDTTYVVAEGRVAEIRKEEETEVIENEAEPEPEAEPADAPEAEEEARSIEDRIADMEQALAELRDGIEAITNAIAAIVGRLETVEEKISGLEEPAAEPAEEGEETEQKFVSKMSYLKRK